MSVPYAFNFDQLQTLANKPSTETVLISLVKFFNPLMQEEVLHFTAHFADAQGVPLNLGRDFEVACPYPPGWNTGHDPDHPTDPSHYLVDFRELARCSKYIITKDDIQPAFDRSVTRNQIKQLICVFESPNEGTEAEPLLTQIRFCGDLANRTNTNVGPIAMPFTPTPAAKELIHTFNY